MNYKPAVVTAIIALGAFVLVNGAQVRSENHAEKLAEDSRLAAVSVTKEAIRLSLSKAALQLPLLQARSEKPTRWMVLRAENWAVVSNTSAGKSLCPAVLRDYIDPRSPRGGELEWSVKSMDVFLSTNKGLAVEVQAYVPRPLTAPDGLASCPAMGYDAERKQLTFEGLPLAIWSGKQLGETRKLQPEMPVPVFVY